MRKRTISGMVTGAIVGATAMGIVSMMDRNMQQKIGRYAAKSAHRVAHMASGFFNK